MKPLNMTEMNTSLQLLPLNLFSIYTFLTSLLPQLLHLMVDLHVMCCRSLLYQAVRPRSVL